MPETLTIDQRLAQLEKELSEVRGFRTYTLTYKKGSQLLKKHFSFKGSLTEAKLYAISHCEKLQFIRFVHCGSFIFDLAEQEKDIAKGIMIEDGSKA